MNIWLIIGILLLLWVVYDLFSGKVWLHREVERATEPTLYWFGMAAYFFLAISCVLPFLSRLN